MTDAMGEASKIQWTNHTWNPWHGCQKVSAGCKFCYMYRDKERYKQDPTTVLKSKSNFHQPNKWKEPALVFTCSWSDWFIEDADPWREEAWAIIKANPHLTFQILTKRPERIAACLPDDWGEGYPNVWLGVSVENQAMAELRIPLLQEIPAAVRFLSVEPLIGAVNLDDYLQDIHWVIVGGESGNDTGKYRYRPCDTGWIKDIMVDCAVHQVPIFVKQLGTYIAKNYGMKDRHGGNISEWPPYLQEREFPKTIK